jgi:hypothetical protein
MSYAHKLVSLAAAGVLGVAAMASAQGGPGMGWGRGPDMMMSAHDADKDGFISAAEHQKWAGDVFAAMDANSDAQLSREEYLAVHMGPGPGPGGNPERMAVMRHQADARKSEEFSKMDSDNDGFVTQAQFLARAESNFSAQDANKDGKISANEFRSWHRK